MRGESKKGTESVTYQPETRTLALAYVVRAQDEGDATDVVAGVFLLFSTLVYTLIDPSSSHSYVSKRLFKMGNMKSEMLRIAMSVSILFGQTILVDKVRNRFPLEIQNLTFPIDMLIMPFGNFDVILDMDWLTEHGVVLDCCKKKFTIQGLNGEVI